MIQQRELGSRLSSRTFAAATSQLKTLVQQRSRLQLSLSKQLRPRALADTSSLGMSADFAFYHTHAGVGSFPQPDEDEVAEHHRMHNMRRSSSSLSGRAYAGRSLVEAEHTHCDMHVEECDDTFFARASPYYGYAEARL